MATLLPTLLCNHLWCLRMVTLPSIRRRSSTWRSSKSNDGYQSCFCSMVDCHCICNRKRKRHRDFSHLRLYGMEHLCTLIGFLSSLCFGSTRSRKILQRSSHFFLPRSNGTSSSCNGTSFPSVIRRGFLGARKDYLWPKLDILGRFGIRTTS